MKEDEVHDIDVVLQKICEDATFKIVEDPKYDVSLLDILKRHIITSLPDEDAVEKAIADIKKLADMRAGS